ncbi:MAG: hypothetical protein COA45_00895 [Zetaproteobacteria bacterium]|nr:MAG: hypothetical protein COA45_00895 [Zetaproteobacteria bacterium]
MKHTKHIFYILCLISLSACQTLTSLQDNVSDLATGDYTPTHLLGGTTEALLASPCPQVELVSDLSSLSDFSTPNKPIESHLISRVSLNSAESTCKLASKSAIVDLTLIFDGVLGKKGRQKASDKPFFSYPFFIAVTAPNGKIMAKEIFAASLTYGANENKHTYFEKLRQIIPIKNKAHANLYKVLIGFQVTPDQLAYNREHLVPVPSKKQQDTK